MRHATSLLACVVAGAALFSGHVPAEPSSDALPSGLVKHLVKKRPGLSVPAMRSLDAASVEADVRDGGSGCYVLAHGKFVDATSDAYAFYGVTTKGHPQLVVAFKIGEEWALQNLPTFCDDVEFCYVRKDGPGSYTRSAALNSPPVGKNEREEVRSSHDVVVAGHLESTAVTYAKQGDAWVYVWTSD